MIPVEVFATFPPIVNVEETVTVPLPLFVKLPVIPDAPVGVVRVKAPALSVTLPVIETGPPTTTPPVVADVVKLGNFPAPLKVTTPVVVEATIPPPLVAVTVPTIE
jgi:hypothetical protein